MDNNIELTKEAFTKISYEKIINSEFTSFGVTKYEDDIKKTMSVEEFFIQYNQLFYDIPSKGEYDSHEYLAMKSGEYSEFDKNSEIIEALQKEISNLRTENLSKDLRILELETGEEIDPNITTTLAT